MTEIRVDINRLLLLLIGIVAGTVILTTIIAFFCGKRPGMNMRRTDPSGVEQIKDAPQDLKAFKEFGTIRITTAPDPETSERAFLVVTPWFSFLGNDSAFYEELVSRKKRFSAFVLEYFSSRTKNELLSTGEKQIKEQLLERFNSELTLGKLSAIYFDDYMFLD